MTFKDIIMRPVMLRDRYYTIGEIGICEWEWRGSQEEIKQSKTKNFFWSYENAKIELLKMFPEFEGRV